LAGDDGGGVGDERGFDQFLALVELGGGQGSEKEKGKRKNEKGPADTAEV
jgi:hypothetical protein